MWYTGGMAEQQENPIHWDQHASKWNLTLIFGAAVLLIGIVTFLQDGSPILPALGLVMAAYSWLTTPRQYLLYRDRLMVVYGAPRTRVISFAEISHIETLALPFGERLRLRMVSGSRVMLTVRDPGAFRDHLEDALSRYHGEQSGEYVAGRSAALDEPSDWAAGERADEPADAPETETYPGRVQEAPRTSGSYTETDAAAPPTPEPGDAPPPDAPRTSGSHTEPPTPDYSGEGRPTYGADVDVDTGRPADREERDRPPSPY